MTNLPKFVKIRQYSPEEKTQWVKDIAELTKKMPLKEAYDQYLKVLRRKRPDMTLTKLVSTYKNWKATLEGRPYHRSGRTNQAQAASADQLQPSNGSNGHRPGTVRVSHGQYLIEGDPDTVEAMLRRMKDL